MWTSFKLAITPYAVLCIRIVAFKYPRTLTFSISRCVSITNSMHEIYRNLIRLRLWKLYLQIDIDRGIEREGRYSAIHSVWRVWVMQMLELQSRHERLCIHRNGMKAVKIGVDVNEYVPHSNVIILQKAILISFIITTDQLRIPFKMLNTHTKSTFHVISLFAPVALLCIFGFTFSTHTANDMICRIACRHLCRKTEMCMFVHVFVYF